VYDWKAMRIGKQIQPTITFGVPRSDAPKARKSMLKYLAIGVVLPISMMIRKAIRSKRQRKDSSQVR
jgi:hypothetical protein